MDFWSFIFQPFLFMAKIGKKFEIRTLIANMIVLNLLICASFPKDKGDPLSTFELKSLKTQSPSSVISEVDDGFTYEICSEFTIDVIKNFSLKHVNFDSEDFGANPFSFSENQWTAMEEQISLNSTVQEYPPTVEPHYCEIKQPEERMKNHVFDNVDSLISSEENNNLEIASNDVNFFKHYNWSFIILLILLLDGMISFIGKKLQIGIGVMTTIVLGYGILGRIQCLDNVPIVMYIIAYSLMFLSLILKCASKREWLSNLVIGVAYTCSTFGIFSVIINKLPPEYAFACMGILILVGLFSVVGDGTT